MATQQTVKSKVNCTSKTLFGECLFYHEGVVVLVLVLKNAFIESRTQDLPLTKRVL